MNESMNESEFEEKWSFPNAIEVCIPPGWVGLVDGLLECLVKTGFDTGQVDQIKEKLGGLRFYASGRIRPVVGSDYKLREHLTKEQETMIALAESDSYRTCSVCGRPGKPKTRGGWVTTVCVEHGYEETPHDSKVKIARSQSHDLDGE